MPRLRDDLTTILTDFFFLSLFPSQRLVPDSGVRLLCMEPAGGRGIVRSSPHTALDCTRPSKIKPTLLSASHNPQGGDDLDCPVKSMWSFLFLPKPCVCVCLRVFVCMAGGGGGVEHQGSNERAKDPPRKCCPCIRRGLPVWLEVGGTIATAMGLLSCGSKALRVQVKGCRNKPS